VLLVHIIVPCGFRCGSNTSPSLSYLTCSRSTDLTVRNSLRRILNCGSVSTRDRRSRRRHFSWPSPHNDICIWDSQLSGAIEFTVDEAARPPVNTASVTVPIAPSSPCASSWPHQQLDAGRFEQIYNGPYKEEFAKCQAHLRVRRVRPRRGKNQRI